MTRLLYFRKTMLNIENRIKLPDNSNEERFPALFYFTVEPIRFSFFWLDLSKFTNQFNTLQKLYHEKLFTLCFYGLR